MMNYSTALDTARVRAKLEQPTKLVHPFLPFPITIDRSGNIKIGPFSVGMTVEQFTLSNLWRVEE